MESRNKKINIIKKLVGIGIIIVVLQIPIIQLWGLLYERQNTQREAIYRIEKSSGPAQTVIGPVLDVPYIISTQTPAPPSNLPSGHIIIFPDNLLINAKLIGDSRYLGIFKVPTYTVELDFSGTFLFRDLKLPEGPPVELLWNEAQLNIGIKEPRAIKDQQAFEWNQSQIDFEPTAEVPALISDGVHVQLPGLSTNQNDPQSFHAKLTLGGTQGLFFVPVGKSTEVILSGNWSDPSFTGVFSPTKREISNEGFSVNWKISDLGGGFGRRQYAAMLENQQKDCLGNGSLCHEIAIANYYEFGVRLINSVDTYRIIDRAVKYQLLIVGLTFTTLLLFELINGLRLHPVQYFLVGVALVLFYILLLSLSEHLGFLLSYLLASASIVALIGGYSFSVLNSKKRAWTIILALSSLYLYLFSALTSEDYALLSGSLGFMVVLAIVMYVTRKIDWYELTEPKNVNV